jgi:hypothetical protein
VRSPPSAPTNLAKGDPLHIPPLLLEGDDPAPVTQIGPGEKFALGPQPTPAAPAQATLPESYGTARLLLLASDPRRLYAYWDLTSEQQRHYNSLSAEGHLAVRVHDTSPDSKVAAEVPVHPESRHWSIEVQGEANPESTAQAQGIRTGYRAQLGYYDRSGQWVIIAKSEPVAPFGTEVEDEMVRFVTVSTEAPAQGTRPGAARGPTAITPPRVAWLVGQPFEPEAIPVHSDSPFVSFDPSLLPANWSAEQERALAEMLGLADVRRIWMNSLELAELVRGERRALSSPTGGGAQDEKAFWLRLNAELIIYGATEPDARLTLGGQPVQLRPDGTFSCRFALPDGEHEVEVTAISVAGESRHAILSFTRQTRTEGDVGARPQD